MYHLLLSLATLYAWPFALFVFFCAYVCIIQAKESGRLKEANWLFKLAAWMVIIFGGLIDISFNLIPGSILFLELPERRNITFTHRCAKWMVTDGWRGSIAKSICRNLSVFEPGHCKPRT